MSREIYNKNAKEKALLEEAYSNVYKPRVIEERLVDGKLMCPEACCGEPVMECTCGPKCEHCNCNEIQKLAEKKGISINEAAEIINEAGPIMGAIGAGLRALGSAAATGAKEQAKVAAAEAGKAAVDKGVEKAKGLIGSKSSDEESSGEINVFDHLAKYFAEIAEDIIIDNPDEQVAPEAAFEMAVEMIELDLKNIKYEDVKDKLDSFYETNPELTRGMKPHGGHDYESWHEFMRDYEEHGN